MASSETVNLGPTFDPGTTTPVDNGKAPRKRTPKAVAAAAAPAKRAGRPAAPQTVGESLDAFRAKVQAARKTLFDAKVILIRMGEVEASAEELGTVNWGGRDRLLDRFQDIEFELLGAQLAIGTTPYTKPTDKI